MLPSESTSKDHPNIIDLTEESYCEIISNFSSTSNSTSSPLFLRKFSTVEEISEPLPTSPVLIRETSSSSESLSTKLTHSEDISLIKTVNTVVTTLKLPQITKKTLKNRPRPNAITLISSEPSNQLTTPLRTMEKKCPICLDPLKDPSVTLCGHLYCLECIKSVVKSTKLCPICRTKLTAKSFHRLYL